MGSYLFKWEHPECDHVYVTGTFDDWSKSVKLDRVGEHFEKVVSLSKIDENIYYKFVVDEVWTTNHTLPQETDPSGNVNNVLRPEEIKKDVAAADLGSSDLPGAFPETPAAENQQFSVNPIAGTAGIGNPIQVPAGQALPPSTKSINDNVTLDKASYDNAGAATAPQLPNVVTPERERVSRGGMFGLDDTAGAGTIIPESGLAMGAAAGAGFGAAAFAGAGPHISSIGPNSTTAQLASQVPLESREAPHISSIGPDATTTGLASQVPLESRNDPHISSIGPNATTTGLASQVPLEQSGVPDVVEKSQETAHASPEASANSEAVQEKSAVEQELQSKVPEAPATSDNSISGKAVGLAAGAAATATAAAAGAAAYITSTKTGQDLKSQLPTSAQTQIDNLAKSSNGNASHGTPIASTVPDTVQESISKSHQSPEAAANSEAVKEKSAVESELLQKTHAEGSAGAIAATVPDTVQESISKAHVTPEAAGNAEAVQEKSAVESELLKKVHTEQAGGEPAPTVTAATTETAPKPTESSHTGAAIAGGFGAAAGTSAALAAIAGKSGSSSTPATTTQPTTTSTTGKSATTSTESPSVPTTTSSSVKPTTATSGSLAVPATSTSTTKPTTATSDSLAAPASSQAQSSATTAAASESTPGRDPARKRIDSRDVSPMTRGPNDTASPIVTTGVASTKTEAKSTPAAAAVSTPKKTTTSAAATSSTPTPAATSSSAAASPSSAKTGESPATDKKKNRRSGFFGRLKEKLHHSKEKN